MANEESRAAARRGKVRRGIKPRTADDYTNEAFGQSDSNIWAGDYTLNVKVCRMNVIRPRAKEGIMVARFWPSMDYAHPESKLERGRTSADPRGQGHWIRRMPAASYIGVNDGRCEKCTFLLYKPGDQEAKAADPYRALYFAADAAHKAGSFANGRQWDPEWTKLLLGKKNEGPALSRPGAIWFAQGECYLNGEKDYLEDRERPLGGDPDDDLVVFQFPVSVGDAMFEILDIEKKKGFDGDPEKDPAGPYLLGDPCGVHLRKEGIVKGGLFFTIWNPKRYRFKPPEKTIHSWDGKVAKVQGYEAMARRQYLHESDTFTPDLDPDRTANVFDKSQFWYGDDTGEEQGLLRLLTVDEKFELIFKAFKTVPKLLQFAFADRWDDIPEKAKAVLSERVQAASPGLPGETDEDEDDADVPPSKREKAGKGKKGKKDPTQAVETEGDDDVNEFDDDAKPADADVDEDADEDEDEDTETTTDADDEDADDDEDEDVDDDESEDDEDAESDEDEDDDDDEDDDEDDEFAGADVDEDDDEDEDEDEDDESDEDEDEDDESDADDESDEDEDATPPAAAQDFDPEQEASAKEKEMAEKMGRSQAAAEGRGKKRDKAPQAAPPTPPAAPPKSGKSHKTGGKTTVAEKAPAEAPAASAGKTAGKTGHKPATASKPAAAPAGKPSGKTAGKAATAAPAGKTGKSGKSGK